MSDVPRGTSQAGAAATWRHPWGRAVPVVIVDVVPQPAGFQLLVEASTPALTWRMLVWPDRVAFHQDRRP